MLQSIALTGLPIAEGINSAFDLPHTLTFAINYRTSINAFNELPKDKRPPRNLWDKPYRLSQFLAEVYGEDTKPTDYVDFDDEEVE